MFIILFFLTSIQAIYHIVLTFFPIVSSLPYLRRRWLPYANEFNELFLLPSIFSKLILIIQRSDLNVLTDKLNSDFSIQIVIKKVIHQIFRRYFQQSNGKSKEKLCINLMKTNVDFHQKCLVNK